MYKNGVLNCCGWRLSGKNCLKSMWFQCVFYVFRYLFLVMIGKKLWFFPILVTIMYKKGVCDADN